VSTRHRGTTSGCFEHFAHNFPGDASVQLLAEFCKVQGLAVQQWVGGKRFPQGEALIRLQVFLHLAEYRVNELLELPKPLRQLAQVIAVDVLSVEDVRTQLGYHNTQEVYRLLRNGGLIRDRQNKLERILGENSKELDRQLATWRAQIEDLLAELEKRETRIAIPVKPAEPADEASAEPPVLEAKAQQPEQPEPSPVRPILGYERAVMADHLVAALSALLENGDSSTLTPTGEPDPRPLPQAERLIVATVVDANRRRRLMAQLLLLDSDSSL